MTIHEQFPLMHIQSIHCPFTQSISLTFFLFKHMDTILHLQWIKTYTTNTGNVHTAHLRQFVNCVCPKPTTDFPPQTACVQKCVFSMQVRSGCCYSRMSRQTGGFLARATRRLQMSLMTSLCCGSLCQQPCMRRCTSFGQVRGRSSSRPCVMHSMAWKEGKYFIFTVRQAEKDGSSSSATLICYFNVLFYIKICMPLMCIHTVYVQLHLECTMKKHNF